MARWHTLFALAASCAVLISASPVSPDLPSRADPVVNQTKCDGRTFTYQQLAGYGFVASDARDKFGDTLGGYGSAIALDKKAWKRTGDGKYAGVLYALPDRGWNTQGTLNYQNRVHKFGITLTLQPKATVASPSGPNLQFTYQDTILFTGPDGTPVTGLDADVTGSITYPGFPILPVATYTGDGFGGAGAGGKRIAIDSEGLVLASDGGFWISDEYGPYIYHFSASGRMTQAIMPPDAYIPHRNGSVSFSADSPPVYNPSEVITPADTETGRDNNQGLEGLTASADGKTLYALMQSALDQEGGPDNPNRLQARLLEYDISDPTKPSYKSEFVVTLPLYKTSKSTKVAGQSDLHSLGRGQFLIVARDSKAGRGQSSTTSIYRHADIFDISGSSDATNIKSKSNDAVTGSIASGSGNLNKGIKAADYCTFLDYNVNSELGKFGLHNGGAQDENLLNEKWESLAMVPVNGNGGDGKWFVFSLSDNDFITQNGTFDLFPNSLPHLLEWADKQTGFLNFGNYPYKDSSGFNIDNQALVFQVQLPKSATPS